MVVRLDDAPHDWPCRLRTFARMLDHHGDGDVGLLARSARERREPAIWCGLSGLRRARLAAHANLRRILIPVVKHKMRRPDLVVGNNRAHPFLDARYHARLEDHLCW